MISYVPLSPSIQIGISLAAKKIGRINEGQVMGILNINDIKEGMELAEDIVNLNGMVVLKAGSIITERYIQALMAWGIAEANIRGVEKEGLGEPSLEAVDPEVIARIDKDLTYLFQKTDLENPIVAEIYRLVRKREAMRAHE